MHQDSLDLMAAALKRFVPDTLADDPPHVLDVGARDVNGTYRPLIKDEGMYYEGLDIVSGPNVDILAENPWRYPIETGVYEIVISGSTAYAVLDLVSWVKELARCVRPGGLMVVITPNLDKPMTYHNPEIDLWRMTETALRMLFENTGVLAEIEITTSKYDLCASALRIRGEVDEPKQSGDYVWDMGKGSAPISGTVAAGGIEAVTVRGMRHPSQTPKGTPKKAPPKVAKKGK